MTGRIRLHRSNSPGEWVPGGRWPETDGVPWPFIRTERDVALARVGAVWTKYAEDRAWSPYAFERFGGDLLLVGDSGIALTVDASMMATAEKTGTKENLFDVVREGDGTYYVAGEHGLVLERRP
jgi:hypothetical protein